MALHLSTGPLKKPALGWSLYGDANPVPTSPITDDTVTVPSGPVLLYCSQRTFIAFLTNDRTRVINCAIAGCYLVYFHLKRRTPLINLWTCA